MKFHFLICFIAIIFIELTTALRRTTPMRPQTEPRQSAAAMIDLVNNAYNNDRSWARRARYNHLNNRRVHSLDDLNPWLANVQRILHTYTGEPSDQYIQRLADTVRYHFIDNPEVLEEYQKKNNGNPSEEFHGSVVNVRQAETPNVLEHQLEKPDSETKEVKTKHISEYTEEENSYNDSMDDVEVKSTAPPEDYYVTTVLEANDLRILPQEITNNQKSDSTPQQTTEVKKNNNNIKEIAEDLKSKVEYDEVQLDEKISHNNESNVTDLQEQKPQTTSSYQETYQSASLETDTERKQENSYSNATEKRELREDDYYQIDQKPQREDDNKENRSVKPKHENLVKVPAVEWKKDSNSGQDNDSKKVKRQTKGRDAVKKKRQGEESVESDKKIEENNEENITSKKYFTEKDRKWDSKDKSISKYPNNQPTRHKYEKSLEWYDKKPAWGRNNEGDAYVIDRVENKNHNRNKQSYADEKTDGVYKQTQKSDPNYEDNKYSKVKTNKINHKKHDSDKTNTRIRDHKENNRYKNNPIESLEDNIHLSNTKNNKNLNQQKQDKIRVEKRVERNGRTIKPDKKIEVHIYSDTKNYKNRDQSDYELKGEKSNERNKMPPKFEEYVNDEAYLRENQNDNGYHYPDMDNDNKRNDDRYKTAPKWDENSEGNEYLKDTKNDKQQESNKHRNDNKDEDWYNKKPEWEQTTDNYNGKVNKHEKDEYRDINFNNERQ